MFPVLTLNPTLTLTLTLAQVKHFVEHTWALELPGDATGHYSTYRP